MKKILLSLFVCCAFSIIATAQVKIDDQQSIEYYVKNVLLGPDVEVANIRFTGMNGSVGSFEAGKKILGIKSGVVLSTGRADGVVGPNTAKGFTSRAEKPNTKEFRKAWLKGDRDLNGISKGLTRDFCVIEFDFVPVNNKLQFQYVFASDEYPEYVGSGFNDVFGFFLSGPGIKNKKNLALLPDGKTPVTINNVNMEKNGMYYRTNESAGQRLKSRMIGWYIKHFVRDEKKIKKLNSRLMRMLQFDGLTTVLSVSYDVIPFKKYHIKIAVADVSDDIYDSAVFIEAGSFTSTVDEKGLYYPAVIAARNNKPAVDTILGATPLVRDSAMHAHAADERFEFTDILFEHDSYTLTETATRQLEQLAEYLVQNTDFNCHLIGHTDKSGSEQYNKALSDKRAAAVKEFLIRRGVVAARLSSEGMGFKKASRANSTQPDAKERRVELILE